MHVSTVCQWFAQRCRQHAGQPNQGHFLCGPSVGRKGKENFIKEKKINEQFQLAISAQKERCGVL